MEDYAMRLGQGPDMPRKHLGYPWGPNGFEPFIHTFHILEDLIQLLKFLSRRDHQAKKMPAEGMEDKVHIVHGEPD